jgi:glutamate racemase
MQPARTIVAAGHYASLKGMGSNAPIGVFDSGVGGLSVLRHIRAALPSEELLYFADSGFAPYGDKPDSAILARSFRITEFLLDHGAKALVVACNSATAAAIRPLRARYPDLPVVGIEPGLKPAALLTLTGVVGVLATRSTLASAKFKLLHDQVSAGTKAQFLLQACSGLADQIEKGELQSAATIDLVRQYVAPLLARGADTLVLGCTHYPFIEPLIKSSILEAGLREIRMVDTGEAVTRQLMQLLKKNGLQQRSTEDGSTIAFTSGNESALAHAFSRLLNFRPSICTALQHAPEPRMT